MRVFDESKTKELKEYDLSKGYLKEDTLLVAHHEAVEAVEEVGHYEIVREYPNGGKDEEWVVDVSAVEAKPAQDEWENIKIFIPYTEKELAELEIVEMKCQLAATDYKAIKYAEGLISEADYAAIREQRQGWRDKINELERKIGGET